MENHQLYHHGIKGMRWGVRRFQNKDGTLTALGKKRAKSEPDDKPEEDYETRKKRALESGSAKDVLEFKGKLTNQELQTALTRLNLESQLSSISQRNVKSGMDRVTSIMDNVEKARQAVEKGASAYNTVAKITNSLAGTNLPSIDGNGKKESAADKALRKAKERLIKSGTPDEIVDHFGEFTVSELKDIYGRWTKEDQIVEYRNKRKKTERKERLKNATPSTLNGTRSGKHRKK